MCLLSCLVAQLVTTLPTVLVEGEADVRISDDVVSMTSTGAVSFVRIKWPCELPRETLVLNDAWERSYGDLEWKSLAEMRVSPWYYLASVSNRTWGVGVETGPGAMCCWEVTTNATTLILDLRTDAQGVSDCAGGIAGRRIDLGLRAAFLQADVSESETGGDRPRQATLTASTNLSYNT